MEALFALPGIVTTVVVGLLWLRDRRQITSLREDRDSLARSNDGLQVAMKVVEERALTMADRMREQRQERAGMTGRERLRERLAEKRERS